MKRNNKPKGAEYGHFFYLRKLETDLHPTVEVLDMTNDKILVHDTYKDEYVTHVLDLNGNRICGHYFKSLDVAREDFNTRL